MNEIKKNNELRKALQGIIKYSRMMRLKRTHFQNTNATFVRNTFTYRTKQALNKIINNALQLHDQFEDNHQVTHSDVLAIQCETHRHSHNRHHNRNSGRPMMMTQNQGHHLNQRARPSYDMSQHSTPANTLSPNPLGSRKKEEF
jgi:hypothetical protein